MIRQTHAHKIPSYVRNGFTIQKDLLYKLSTLFDDDEIRDMIATKRALKAKKLHDFNAMMERVEITNNFFAR